MSRLRVLTLALALGGLAAIAGERADAGDHRERVAEFQHKALEERKAQKLDADRKALYAKYPTPELKIASVKDVRLGGEETIQATGRFQAGSLVVPCHGVELLSHKLADTHLEARVRVTVDARPGPCELRVYAPVSAQSTGRPALNVVGLYAWELALSNGMKARMRTGSEKGTGGLHGSAEWFDAKGKSQGSRDVELSPRDTGYQITVRRTREEEAAARETYNTARKDAETLAARDEAREIQKKMREECQKLPPDKLGPCMQKYTPQIAEAAKRMQNRTQQTQHAAEVRAVGCNTLTLEVRGGRVTGKAEGCGERGEVRVTGAVTPGK
jgi:hypothetical protein